MAALAIEGRGVHTVTFLGSHTYSSIGDAIGFETCNPSLDGGHTWVLLDQSWPDLDADAYMRLEQKVRGDRFWNLFSRDSSMMITNMIQD